MVNISPTAQLMLAIVGGLVIIPGMAYFAIEKSHEYTDEVGPKKLGYYSAKHGKRKSRKLRYHK